VLIAELTHRCPLRCAYCSNPERLTSPRVEVGTRDWQRVLAEAAQLGVWQLHLTGGEPLLRDDLQAIAASARDERLYTTLVTSGLGPGRAGAGARLGVLAAAGVRAVQVSFQDTDDERAAAVAGRAAFAAKLAFARRVVELGISLTLNVVLHRANLARLDAFVQLALELGADRLELAHVQYHGWAQLNRLQLLPTREQIERANRQVALAKLEHSAHLEILYVMPDHFSDRARPCMGGWGRQAMVVSPSGEVLPCHAAGTLPFQHDRIQERSLSDIWHNGQAFQAFRGEAWLEEPCRGCPERAADFGGCRCQALAFTGRATATDPACPRSVDHPQVIALRRRASEADLPPRYLLRRMVPERQSERRGE
jgi:pyrroloquinoline quinone biosynthesis protein E